MCEVIGLGKDRARIVGVSLLLHPSVNDFPLLGMTRGLVKAACEPILFVWMLLHCSVGSVVITVIFQLPLELNFFKTLLF